jgi:RNA polymerase sigma-70 factor, ECF subfamily
MEQMERRLPAELTELSEAGEKESLFENIYRRYYQYVYCVCLKMTRNGMDAEDLAQDTFLQVRRNISGFRGEAALKTWLYRVTVNQVLMNFRKVSTSKEVMTENGEMPEVTLTAFDRALQMPIIDHLSIADAVKRLPPGYRKIFVLHDVEGYEHEEIASLLGISPGTSKSQLHKARLKMRCLLLERFVESSEKLCA